MAIDEAAYLAAYRNPYLDKVEIDHHAHIDEIELEGVTLHKDDCVKVDHWMHGKTRDAGKFQYAWRERGRSKHLTVLVWTDSGGFRAVPARMAHPCTTGSSGAPR